MEKVIFLGLAIPILVFVLYLGVKAIMSGFTAKEANRPKEEDRENNNLSGNNDQLIDEIKKLNELHQSGVLTQEEFDRAKKKILDN
tara:strand:- start:330 stop:587 length:258 start_codon:yes stop_codon:yes gene_type:complete